MKILLAQSYFRILDQKELDKNMPYPPLGALYAATILKNFGYEIIFFDSMLSNSISELEIKIRSAKPDILVLYDDEFNYLTKMCLSNMRNAAVGFIKTAKELRIPSIVYSSDAADFPEGYLNAGCNSIIYGEGEITLKELLNSFKTNHFDKVKYQINGIRFIEEGKIFSTDRRRLMEDINSLPIPDYSFINIDKYKNIWLKKQNYFSMNISTTRGCPYKCNWCAKPLYGQTYNSISPEKAVQQIKLLKEKYEVDHLWITDDIFGLKPNWIKNFSDELKKFNLKVPFKCLSRPDLLLRGNTIQDLKESGCRTIWIGAESGSQKILNAMEKGTTVKQIYEAAEKTHKAGIEIAFFIQFGYLNENWYDIKLTRKMIKDCTPDDIGISVSYPLPGTEFYEKVKSELRDKENWTDSDDLDLMFIGTFPKSFYKVLHRFIHSEYRLYKIMGRMEWKKLPTFLINVVRYFCLKLKIGSYIKKNKTSLSITFSRLG
jgi:anaerobic magnesium-protoporphyrin IX monomethyl ester cyclase